LIEAASEYAVRRQAGPEAEESAGWAEIVVPARKRKERPQDTPIVITTAAARI
jgi:hypothetical protein